MAGTFRLIASRMNTFFVVWVVVCGTTNAQERIVSIRSWGGGFGSTPESALRFSCSPSIEGSSDQRCQQFRAVLAAARQRGSASSNPMGITPQWLTANVDEAVRRDLPDHHTPAQLALFRSTFTDASLTSELLKYFCCHTDDYPHARIEVSGQSAGKMSLVSDSQNVFMVPWHLEENGKRWVVNDRGVGDALYRILPAGFANRDRIGGINLRAKYSEVVLYHIRDKWDMAGSMSSLGAGFDQLNRRFKIVESSITAISSNDTDGYGWWGKARLPDGSVRGEIGFFFPMSGNKPPSLAAFNSQIDGLISRLQSIQWLSRYLAVHASAHVELRFVDDRSLSTRARDSLLEDLRKNGKRGLADRVAVECGACISLEIEDNPGAWSRWINFPNGDMLLWHFQGKTALGYSAMMRRSWDYYGWKGVALLVHPDGKLSE